jgi:glycosyltransferase involved in cell wall biosynthesis
MRIGLESSFAARPYSGIGVYLTGLEQALRRRSDVEVVPIAPADHRLLDRFGERAGRFSWEVIRAGLASRGHDIDLLHVPLMAVPIGARVPVVTTVHDVIPYVLPAYRHSLAMRVNLEVVRRRIHAARAIIAPSNHAAMDIEHVLGIPAERIHVTWEAVDPIYQPASGPPPARLSELGIAGPYIFNIGGYDVRKNLPMLIEAFSDVVARHQGPLSLVIGGAPHSGNPTVFPPLEPIIAARGIGDCVVLTGRIDESDKLTLMQHATIYATPSTYEGFGLPALEAMACGVPVVAADRSSFPEILEEAACLIEPTRDALATALSDLLEHPERAAALAEAGVRRAESFSWDRCADETVAVYRQVLEVSEKMSR